MKRRKPIRITVGNALVSIYVRTQRKESGDYQVFEVADKTGGKRKLISFASEEDARAKATEIATKLANLEGASLLLTARDRQVYLDAVEALKPTGTPLHIAVADYAAARARLGSRSLAEAVGYYLARNPVTIQSLPVREAIAKMVAAKKSDSASKVYVDDLEKRLKKFEESFSCDLGTITEPAVTEWLRGGWQGRSRNNYRGAVATLFRFAAAEGWVSKDHLDFDRIPKAKEAEMEVGIFTPKEMTALLAAAQRNPDDLPRGVNRRNGSRNGLLALLILGGFAGMRTAEVQRQLWSDINLERGFIRVTAAKGGTAAKRTIPITDNLRAWLAVCGRDSEVCCDYPRPADAMDGLAKRAGVEWEHNGLRHSFVSYRLAITHDLARVSLESGNSPGMIQKHYKELVGEAEAQAWFNIFPTTVEVKQ